jgi:hypothetical protein
VTTSLLNVTGFSVCDQVQGFYCGRPETEEVEEDQSSHDHPLVA